MKLGDFFIWLLLITGVVIGGRLLYHDVADTYSVSRSENFTAFDDYFNDTYSEIEDIEAKIEDSKVTGVDAVDYAFWFVKSAYQALKLTVKIPGLYSNMIAESIKILNLPSWVSLMVTGIITVTVVFIIVSAALKYRV